MSLSTDLSFSPSFSRSDNEKEKKAKKLYWPKEVTVCTLIFEMLNQKWKIVWGDNNFKPAAYTAGAKKVGKMYSFQVTKQQVKDKMKSIHTSPPVVAICEQY